MTDDKPISGPAFAAAGEDGMRCCSKDGKTWTSAQLGKDGQLYSAIVFGKGQCVAVARFGGSGVSAVTSDGSTWKTANFDAQYAYYIGAVVFFDNRFLGIGSTFYMTSDDGLTWSPRRNFPEKKTAGQDPTMHRFAVGNGLLVGVGDYGNAFVTRNGQDWKFAPDTKPSNALIDVTFGNDVFVAGGMHGLRMRSADGLTWTDRAPGEEGEHINFINFDGKQFVGVGQGATYISPDGVKWERIVNQNAPTIAAYGNGIYVGALWPGKLLHSADGIEWKQVADLPQSVACLAFGVFGNG